MKQEYMQKTRILHKRKFRKNHIQQQKILNRI